jgi:hypothetical protein
MFGKDSNKRLFPRINIKGVLRYQVRGSQEYCNTTCKDISVDGVGFVNDKFIPPLTPLNLEINFLPRTLQPIGKVIWSAPFLRADRYKIGVKFLEFSSEQKQLLFDYITMKLNQA